MDNNQNKFFSLLKPVLSLVAFFAFFGVFYFLSASNAAAAWCYQPSPTSCVEGEEYITCSTPPVIDCNAYCVGYGTPSCEFKEESYCANSWQQVCDQPYYCGGSQCCHLYDCGAYGPSADITCDGQGGQNCGDTSQCVCTPPPSYTYSWKTGTWSVCGSYSDVCDESGTQTRSVWCERSDGTQVDDSYCNAATRPVASQSCTRDTDGVACNDGNLCTTPDTCVNGTCSGTPKICNDNNACTTDSCNTSTGFCFYVNNTNACNDGNACTTGDACSGGSCLGAPKNCNDNNSCTADSCNASTGNCVNTVSGTHSACSGGTCASVANTSSSCTNSCASNANCGGCASNADCNDNNSCTTDICNASTGNCSYTNNTNACNDGNACTTGDACSGGSCLGAPKNCNDNNSCTTDSCNASTGVCSNLDTGACKATIVLTGPPYTFSGTSGGATPAAQNLTIRNSGSVTLNWTWDRVNQAHGTSPVGTWCKLQNSSGTDIPINTGGSIAAGSEVIYKVAVNAPSNAGTFNDCNIRISDAAASNSPQYADITYTVSPGGTTTLCDNAWHLTPHGGMTNAQPVAVYVPASGTSTRYPFSIVLAVRGYTADGRGGSGWVSRCNFNTSNPCTWEAWTDLSGGLTYSPNLRYTSFLYLYSKGSDVLMNNNTYYNFHNATEGWRGWVSVGANDSFAFGKPFRFQDGWGRWWQFRRNSDSTISYYCGNTPVCQDLQFYPLTSGAAANPISETSANPINVNSTFYFYCDYGSKIDSIWFDNNGGLSCTWTNSLGRYGWRGTALEYQCTAPATPGLYTIYCGAHSGTGDNICQRSDPVNITVTNPALSCPAGSVALSPSSVTIGQSSTASAPAGWSGGTFASGNTSVATVSGSVVNSVSVGSANISGNNDWRAPNGAYPCTLSASTLTVQALTCPSGSVTLNPSSVTVGQSSTASAPAGWHDGTYVSSNTAVATVSDDTINGIASGPANISGSNWTASNGAPSCSLNAAPLTVNPPGVTSNCPITPTVNNSVCGKATLNWNDATGESGYNIYRNTTNDPATASLAGSTAANSTTFTDSVASGNYYYWITSYGPSGQQSAKVAVCSTPVFVTACQASLDNSEKDIVAVNGTLFSVSLPNGSLNAGTDPVPASVTKSLKVGDKITFSINLRNQGQGVAKLTTLTDTLINLKEPDVTGWQAAYYNYNGAKIADLTPAVSGTLYNQTLTFDLSNALFDIPVGDVRSLVFTAQLGVPDSYTGSYPRFQNSFKVNYLRDPGNPASLTYRSFSTPLFFFNNGLGTPTFIEMP